MYCRCESFVMYGRRSDMERSLCKCRSLITSYYSLKLFVLSARNLCAGVSADSHQPPKRHFLISTTQSVGKCNVLINWIRWNSRTAGGEADVASDWSVSGLGMNTWTNTTMSPTHTFMHLNYPSVFQSGLSLYLNSSNLSKLDRFVCTSTNIWGMITSCSWTSFSPLKHLYSLFLNQHFNHSYAGIIAQSRIPNFKFLGLYLHYSYLSFRNCPEPLCISEQQVVNSQIIWFVQLKHPR